MKNKQTFEFLFPKGYLAEGKGAVKFHVTGFSFFHVTHVYRATLTEPEDYDGEDIYFEDTIDLGQLLIGDEFDFYGGTCKISEDVNDRIKGFGDIVMKYFREIFKEADNVFLSKLEDLFYDEDEEITDNGDGNEFFDMIPKAFWGNPNFVEELGEYMDNIATNAYNDDYKFQNSLDDDFNRRYAEEKADYDYDSQQEAAEAAYYDMLSRLGL